jgi:hypothetical protein
MCQGGCSANGCNAITTTTTNLNPPAGEISNNNWILLVLATLGAVMIYKR